MKKLSRVILSVLLVAATALSLSACIENEEPELLVEVSSKEVEVKKYTYKADAYIVYSNLFRDIQFTTVEMKREDDVIKDVSPSREKFTAVIGGKTCEFAFTSVNRKLGTEIVFETFTGEAGTISVIQGTDTIIKYICPDTKLFDKVTEGYYDKEEAIRDADKVIAGFEDVDLSEFEVSMDWVLDTMGSYMVRYFAMDGDRYIYCPFELVFDPQGRLVSYKRSEYLGKVDVSEFPDYSPSEAAEVVKQKYTEICADKNLFSSGEKVPTPKRVYLTESFIPGLHYVIRSNCLREGREECITIAIDVTIE